ncbi:hypothetical protein Tco_1347627 [Tanacetum coccineum]
MSVYPTPPNPKHLIDSYAAEGRVMILKLVEAARKFLSEVAPHVSVISDVNAFVQFIEHLPQSNKDKLKDNPFFHFLELKNDMLQIDKVCMTLSIWLDDQMKLQLGSTGSEKEDLNVTKDNFRALMGIVPMDSIDPNSANNIDERLKGKFCTLIGNRIFKDISMKKVKAVLKNENEETDDIKRAYALLVMHKMKQDWAALALSSILKGKYNKEKEKNTKFIGRCVFFLQCCLMRKYDEGFNLFDINKVKIKNFQLKYEDDYGRLSASIGYSEFRGNKIIRKIGEVRNIIKNRRKPLTMNSLLVIDEAVAKFLSEAASLVSKESAATEEGTDAGAGAQREGVKAVSKKQTKNRAQNEIVVPTRLTRNAAQNEIVVHTQITNF